jgi:hypothetical protein
MTTPLLHRLATAVATTALATSLLAGPAIAQAAGPHSHGAGTLHALNLDHGRQWPTDEPLRAGMGRIRSLVEPALGAAKAGALPAARYGELASRIEAEVGTIVADCKLEPQADAMLHLVIAEVVEGADAMAGNDPAQGLVRVATALNEYGRYFDHPGFEPIRTTH